MPTLGPSPTFILVIGDNGQLTISQLVAGDLTSATLTQLFSAQRDISGALTLLQAEIFRNFT